MSDDLISRQAAIDTLNDKFTIIGTTNAIVVQDYIRRVNNRLRDLPSAQPEQKSDIEEAVEYIKNAQEYLRDIGETWCADYLSDSIELLVGGEEKRMIPIKIERREPVMKWIPVSEAMPEESDGTVLVCMPNKFPYNEKEPFVNAKHNRQVETATYSQYSDTWHFKNGGVTSVRPIAWMPLPMPWRGEDDERPDAVE